MWKENIISWNLRSLIWWNFHEGHFLIRATSLQQPCFYALASDVFSQTLLMKPFHNGVSLQQSEASVWRWPVWSGWTAYIYRWLSSISWGFKRQKRSGHAGGRNKRKWYKLMRNLLFRTPAWRQVNTSYTMVSTIPQKQLRGKLNVKMRPLWNFVFYDFL